MHYLDLTLHLPAAPPPALAALALVRRVLDGLAGQPSAGSLGRRELRAQGHGRAAAVQRGPGRAGRAGRAAAGIV